MCVNVELQYWELELELVSLSLANCNLSLPMIYHCLIGQLIVLYYLRYCCLDLSMSLGASSLVGGSITGRNDFVASSLSHPHAEGSKFGGSCSRALLQTAHWK